MGKDCSRRGVLDGKPRSLLRHDAPVRAIHATRASDLWHRGERFPRTGAREGCHNAGGLSTSTPDGGSPYFGGAVGRREGFRSSTDGRRCRPTRAVRGLSQHVACGSISRAHSHSSGRSALGRPCIGRAHDRYVSNGRRAPATLSMLLPARPPVSGLARKAGRRDRLPPPLHGDIAECAV